VSEESDDMSEQEPEIELDLRLDPEWIIAIQRSANDSIMQTARLAMLAVTGYLDPGDWDSPNR
jgi:hypothetical protein